MSLDSKELEVKVENENNTNQIPEDVLVNTSVEKVVKMNERVPTFLDNIIEKMKETLNKEKEEGVFISEINKALLIELITCLHAINNEHCGKSIDSKIKGLWQYILDISEEEISDLMSFLKEHYDILDEENKPCSYDMNNKGLKGKNTEMIIWRAIEQTRLFVFNLPAYSKMLTKEDAEKFYKDVDKPYPKHINEED